MRRFAMSADSAGTNQDRPNYCKWMKGSLILLALVVIARFVLEAAGVPHSGTRYLSSVTVVLLVGIYLGVVAPLRGVRRFKQLVIPAVVVAAWTQAWVIVATVLT